MEIERRYRAVDERQSRERADALCAWLRDYAATRINSRLIDERRCIPPHVALDFGNHGLFGLHVEERHGGSALQCRDVNRVLQQTAALDLGLGTWLRTSMFPGVRPIAAFANETLKETLLPDLASGRMLAGYGQTEPAAGTHFPAMEARAVATGRGTWRVSGDKVWIGNATWAGVLTVMAHEFEGDRRRGLNAYVIPMDSPGVRFGRELLSLGMRGMVQSEISFRDVEVGEESVLGGLGAGLEVGVDSMSFSRFAIAATCVGAMKHCASQMARFADRRQIATGRLIEHPVFRAGFGEVVARTAAGDALLEACGELLDREESVPIELFAVAKVATSEFLWASADRLVQTLGGRGYDESNGAAQLLRDARVTRIFEGTSEALIAYLGQQALSPKSALHPLLRDLFGSPEVADSLAECAVALRARGVSAGGSDTGEPSTLPRTWQLAALGWTAMWAVIVACLRARGDEDPRVLEWAGLQLEQARAAAMHGSPGESVMFAPHDIDKFAERFRGEIGDVLQTLPGAKEELDPLLRPDPMGDGH